jgi:hypothetical protein
MGAKLSDQRGRGRPEFEPNDDQRKNVEILVALGIPEADICALVRDRNDKPISENTLRKHFRKEINHGAGMLNARVGNFMVSTILGLEIPKDSGITPITNESVRGGLLELYVAARMGWRKTVVNQHEGKDGAKTIVYEVSSTDAKL